MSENNKATLMKGNAAIAAGDNEGFLVHCTGDTKWMFVGDRTLKGKKAVRRWMKIAYEKPPRFKVTRLIADHDFVVAMGEITLKGEDGKDARHSYCDVWRFRRGKMAELRAFVVKVKAVRKARSDRR